MDGKILVGESRGNYLIKMTGDVRVTLCASLNHYVESIFRQRSVKSVLVDLLEAEGVDSTTLGLLAKLALASKRYYNIVPVLFCHNASILKTLEIMSLDEFFTIISDTPPAVDVRGEVRRVVELPCDKSDEDEARRSVLEAHRLLVELNPQCKGEFIDLIRYLEDEVSKQP